jgi:hypothetical protein
MCSSMMRERARISNNITVPDRLYDLIAFELDAVRGVARYILLLELSVLVKSELAGGAAW